MSRRVKSRRAPRARSMSPAISRSIERVQKVCRLEKQESAGRFVDNEYDPGPVAWVGGGDFEMTTRSWAVGGVAAAVIRLAPVSFVAPPPPPVSPPPFPPTPSPAAAAAAPPPPPHPRP